MMLNHEKMKYVKTFFLVLAAVAGLSVIAVSIYGIWFLRSELKKDQVFKPTTWDVSEQICDDLPEDARSQSITVTLLAENVDATRQSVETLASTYEGEVLSSRISRTQNFFNGGLELRNASVSVEIPIEHSDAVRSDLAALLPGSRNFEKESQYTRNRGDLVESCRASAISLRKLRAEEELNLELLRQGRGDQQEALDAVSEVVARAGGWESALRSLLRETEVLRLFVNIEEYPAG